jgi:predicted NBD/HSP70 family sugar kinase
MVAIDHQSPGDIVASRRAPSLTDHRTTAMVAAVTGSNIVRVRHFNERVVLHAIRINGVLSPADLARQTQLTPQAVSIIVRQLTREGLLREQGRRYGGVGQPARQYALDPEGAYALGVKLGRRSISLVAIDLVGRIIDQVHHEVAFPSPEEGTRLIEDGARRLLDGLGARRPKVAGIGIATPFNLACWHEQLGISSERYREWDGFALRERLGAATGLPIHVENDGSSAAVAELFFGAGRRLDSFFYVYLGTAIGGGVIVGGDYHRGVTGNAGDFGLMPVETGTGEPDILLSHVSFAGLLEHLRQYADCPGSADNVARLFAARPAIFQAWIARAARLLAPPLIAVNCVLDTEAFVFGGRLPPGLLATLVGETKERYEAIAQHPLRVPAFILGEIDSEAPALGAAMLPFYAAYAPNRDVLLKRR